MAKPKVSWRWLSLDATLWLTASPEPFSRATVRPWLRAWVTGAAGRAGASAAAAISRLGYQSLHSLPEQPWFRYAADTRIKEVKSEATARVAEAEGLNNSDLFEF